MVGDVAASWSAWFRADPRRGDVAIALVTVAVSVVLIVGSPQDFDTGWPEVVAGVGSFVLVLLRRRWPFALLALAVVWGAIHAAIWGASSLPFAALVLLATACVRLERRQAIILGVAVGLALYGIALALNDELSFGDGRSVIALVWTAAAVGVADAVRSWRRYRASSEAEVRSAVLASEARARQQVTEERLTIARELHDLLAHNLSVMNVQNGAALHLLRDDPDRAEEALTAARDAGRSVLDELRELLSVLRDDTTDAAPRRALPSVDDLNGLVDTLRSAGLDITWNDAGRPRPLAPAVSLAAFRIVQEALTNAAKHGDGTALLETADHADGFTITVTNPIPTGTTVDGSPSGGHGLLGMRERATTNGGTFEAGPTAAGFRVLARLPVAPDDLGGRP
jgi:signal transduction histidine kinase